MKKLLILIPTEMEADSLVGVVPEPQEITEIENLPGHPHAAICGFGLPCAAALSAHLLHKFAPSHVLLLGIAGTYDNVQAPVGSLVAGTLAHLRGVGAGQGKDHQAAGDLGFDLGNHAQLNTPWIPLTAPVHDILAGPIISVASASADAQEAESNLAVCEGALVEDMESYGVALSCRLSRIELTVVRAISNVAGQRAKSSWKVNESLATLRNELPHLLSTTF